MSSGAERPIYDFGKPEAGLAEWTSKIKSLQQLVDKDEADERIQLEREIEQSRSERAQRRLSLSNTGTNKGSPSSPVPASQQAPMSLAAFMGGHATGPRLNKVQTQDNPTDLTQFDAKPYSHAASPLAQVARGKGGPAYHESNPGGIPMPGLSSSRDPKRTASPSITSSSITMSSNVDSTPREATLAYINERAAITSSTALGLKPSAPPVTASTFTGAKPSSPTSAASSSLATRKPVSPTGSLAKPIQPNAAVSQSPFLMSSRASPAFSRVDAEKGLSLSLTRLQGRGYVGERVKAAAVPFNDELAQQSRVSGSDSDSSIRTRKKSVLDRWPGYTNEATSTPPPASSGKPLINRNSLPDTTVSSEPSVPLKPTSSPVATKAVVPTKAQDSTLTTRSTSTWNKSPVAPAGLRSPQWSTRSSPYANYEGISSPNSHQPSSSIPLNHLTKGRARRPRKGIPANERDTLHVAPDPLANDYTDTKRPEIRHITSKDQHGSPGVSESDTILPRSLSDPSPKAGPKGSIVSRLAGVWGDQGPIGVKSAVAGPASEVSSQKSSSPLLSSGSNRRALPGLAKIEPKLERGATTFETEVQQSRADSNARPSAMQVAEFISRPNDSIDPLQASWASSGPTIVGGSPRSPPSLISPPSLAQRRSSQDRFSALPPPAEVQTPPQSFSTQSGHAFIAAVSAPADPEPKSRTFPGRQNSTPALVMDTVKPSIFRLGHPETALPKIDVPSILKSSSAPPNLTFDASYTPISTDVFSIVGRTASPISSHPHIFYDTELRAVVYRSKDTRKGLASTTIWTWRGKAATPGEAEEWKIKDLETRFGSKAIRCTQGNEPYDLIGLLGGVIAIRQGTRLHWSTENTSMHCVRTGPYGSTVVIDEVDLNIRNLCSAFSYVVLFMGVIYVWHGRGSLPSEASQAMSYASLLSDDSMSILEFKEGKEDPMFWMCLGDEAWANAEFWAERPSANGQHVAKAWRVKHSVSPEEAIEHLPYFSEDYFFHDAVFVVDGAFEMFILVGKDARGYRGDIRLAIEFAKAMSERVATARPFEPPIHVIILPSQLPLDLKVGHARFLDEDRINGGPTPGHLNVLPLATAVEHLAMSTWPAEELKDVTFLPLGIAPEAVV